MNQCQYVKRKADIYMKQFQLYTKTAKLEKITWSQMSG